MQDSERPSAKSGAMGGISDSSQSHIMFLFPLVRAVGSVPGGAVEDDWDSTT